MAGEALKETIEGLREYAKEELLGVYFRDIYPKVESHPADVRFTEQLQLSNFYLKLSETSRERVEAAFQADGVKWPGLVWGEHVGPKLKQPEFQYCTVRSRPEDEMQKDLPPTGANPDKMLAQKAGASTVAVVVGAAGKIASGHMESAALSSAVSTAGTVLLIVGAVGLVYCAYVSVTGETERTRAPAAGKQAGDSTRVDLEELLKGQVRTNLKEINKWINALAEYASAAEAAAEKVEEKA